MFPIMAMNSANQTMQQHSLPHWLLWIVIIVNSIGLAFVLFHLWRNR